MLKLEGIGNLVADPRPVREVSLTDGRTIEVCNFRVAFNDRQTGKVYYYDIAAWGGLARTCYDSLAKGSLIYAEGVPEFRQNIGTDGKVYVNPYMSLRKIQFLSPKANKADEVEPNTAAAPDNYQVTEEDELPFS